MPTSAHGPQLIDSAGSPSRRRTTANLAAMRAALDYKLLEEDSINGAKGAIMRSAVVSVSDKRNPAGSGPSVRSEPEPGPVSFSVTFSWSGYDPRLQTRTAGLVSEALDGHGKLSRLIYPGRADHPRLKRKPTLKQFCALEHVLARTNPETDLYVFANLSMDTLDYTGPEVNLGSKGVMIGVGASRVPRQLNLHRLGSEGAEHHGHIRPVARHQQAAEPRQALPDPLWMQTLNRAQDAREQLFNALQSQAEARRNSGRTYTISSGCSRPVLVPIRSCSRAATASISVSPPLGASRASQVCEASISLSTTWRSLSLSSERS